MGDPNAAPEVVEPVWLTDVLEDAGVARGAKVTDVEFQGWIGTGQTGRNGRFAVQWDRPEDRPASIVGKFPSADETARSTGFMTGSYLREYIFYDRVAASVGIRVPRCHLATFDHDAPDFALLMEDAVGARQGDQLDGLSLDQIALALEQAVGLHAPRYGEDGLREALVPDGTPVTTPEEAGELIAMFYGVTMTGFLERLGGRLDPEVAQVVTDLAAFAGRWMLGTDSPPTLVHMDFRADNLLFGTTDAAAPLMVVDWQTLGVGSGATDVAYLISGSFPDRTDRAGAERALVEEYRQLMAAAGVEIAADELWRDYRFGSVWGLLITVMATMAAEQTERGDNMFVEMAQRHGWQAIDLDALSLLG